LEYYRDSDTESI
jgi:hypothetical protein